MRHFGKVGYYESTFNVFSNTNGHRVLAVYRYLGTKDIAERHNFAVGVWNLNTDQRFTWNWRKDSNLVAGHGIADVIRKTSYCFHLYAGRQLNLVASNRGAARESHHAGGNVELSKDGRDGFHHDVVGFGFGLRHSARWQHGNRW